jgi:DNA-binding SARP family transcriptional activator
MEFRILGPLEVVDGDRAVALGGAQQRAVLAILLLHANEVVATDRLLDELWGDELPLSAKTVLQGYVSQLRKALGSGWIVTQPPGYVACLEPVHLDLSRFERLAGEGREALGAGRAEVAATRFEEALGLWRGRPIADLAYEPFAAAATARLEELRLAALEDRIEADLALGRHGRLVAELEALVLEHPLRERLRGQLMLALYRSGRQAEALAAYQEARRVLVDDLGIDPSPSLARLETAILRQDPLLELKALPAPTEPAAPERAVLVAPRDPAALGALLALAEPLARRPARELILARMVTAGVDLEDATRSLHEHRNGLAARGVSVRAAAFTSDDPGADVIRLVAEQNVDLVLVDVSAEQLEPAPKDVSTILSRSPCDIGVLVARDGAPQPGPDGPVLVPFGGADHEWTAAELGAWIARATGAPLRLVGTAADPAEGRRDASRLLASASLTVQQVTGVATEPMLVERGADAVIEVAAGAGLVVLGLSERWQQEGLGGTRLTVARRAEPPVLLVRRGLRPSGIAPRDSLTRFTWTISSSPA